MPIGPSDDIPDTQVDSPVGRLRRGLSCVRASRWFIPTCGSIFFIFLISAERDLRTMPFVMICGGFITALTFAISERPRFSLFIAASLLSLSAAASMAKFKYLAINAHVFDLWFYFSKPDTLLFLAAEFRWVVALATAVLAAFLTLAVVVFRADRRMPLRRLLPSGVLLSVIVAVPVTLPSEANDFAYHIQKNHFVSSFFVSLMDIARLSRPGPLTTRLAGLPPATPFPAAGLCQPGAKAPDIVLVLSESAVVPSVVPGWKYDPSILKRLQSYDGMVHRARVETHGGGTWISHTSVMSGLSMADFDWMRPYATMLMNGHLHHGLAESLARCGYRTAMISPESFNFVNEGPLLKSLGIEDYIDREALQAPSKHEADSFYFDKASAYYARHLREDKRPLFLFVATMTAHSPYDFRFEPDRRALGEPFGNDAQTDEYLRRLTFTQEDYAAFLKELGVYARGRPLLAVQFGDHHPVVTRDAFDAAGATNAMADWRSPIYETFYAFTPMNYQPPVPMPRVDVLDLAYLGVTLLESAGLPLDPVYAEEKALRDHCAGAFHTCADRGQVDRFLARLVRSGLLTEPGFATAAEARTNQF